MVVDVVVSPPSRPPPPAFADFFLFHQAGVTSNAMAHVSAALSGGSNYPGGVPGLAGLGVAGALAVPPASAAALAANKVMRELHVGGLPHGVSGVQLQVSE